MPASKERPYTSIGLAMSTYHRIERLRMCMERSRSHVIEQALLHGGIDALEDQYAPGIELLRRLAELRGVRWQAIAEAYAKDNAGRTYPQTLPELMAEHERVALGIEPAPEAIAAA